MLLSEFHYDLPYELIAQEPLEDRAASRMLVVDRSTEKIEDRRFSELGEFLVPEDVVVLNDTKVFPARLIGRSETGAQVEILLISEVGLRRWKALARPAKRLGTGKKITFGDELSSQVLERLADGKIVMEFDAVSNFNETLERVGRTPLPPYIQRSESETDRDRDRYQTVFASRRGAIAAPTAGLHFTQDILQQIREKGVEICHVTLHVGYGTFEPVRHGNLAKHSVIPEDYEITAEAAAQLNRVRAGRGRIIAVGTTTTRALETAVTKHAEFVGERSSAALTVTPGYRFRAVDALLTNFHLPQSSLLILVSSFAGRELIMKAYRHAVDMRYRFYSYGDCMLIL